jgi:hypothetical protein
MPTRKQRTTDASTAPILVIGKDEMNLCELPIAKLGRRDKREIIEFVGEVVKDGQTLTQECIVRRAPPQIRQLATRYDDNIDAAKQFRDDAATLGLQYPVSVSLDEEER